MKRKWHTVIRKKPKLQKEPNVTDFSVLVAEVTKQAIKQMVPSSRRAGAGYSARRADSSPHALKAQYNFLGTSSKLVSTSIVGTKTGYLLTGT